MHCIHIDIFLDLLVMESTPEVLCGFSCLIIGCNLCLVTGSIMFSGVLLLVRSVDWYIERCFQFESLACHKL